MRRHWRERRRISWPAPAWQAWGGSRVTAKRTPWWCGSRLRTPGKDNLVSQIHGWPFQCDPDVRHGGRQIDALRLRTIHDDPSSVHLQESSDLGPEVSPGPRLPIETARQLALRPSGMLGPHNGHVGCEIEHVVDCVHRFEQVQCFVQWRSDRWTTSLAPPVRASPGMAGVGAWAEGTDCRIDHWNRLNPRHLHSSSTSRARCPSKAA